MFEYTVSCLCCFLMQLFVCGAVCVCFHIRQTILRQDDAASEEERHSVGDAESWRQSFDEVQKFTHAACVTSSRRVSVTKLVCWSVIIAWARSVVDVHMSSCYWAIEIVARCADITVGTSVAVYRLHLQAISTVTTRQPHAEEIEDCLTR